MAPKLPSFFKIKIRKAAARLRLNSPSDRDEQQQQYHKKKTHKLKLHYHNSEFSSIDDPPQMNYFNIDGETSAPNLPSESSSSNRVMVVVDSSLEAKGALQWALSHTVQPQDTLILLRISKPSKHGVNSSSSSSSSPSNQKAHELLYSMRTTCQMRRPGVEVEIAVRDGKEKAAIIVEEAKQRKVSLLVLGQKRRSIMWYLHKIWGGRRSRNNRVVEYCIHNANCLTIAVRRKSRKHGGYLITTKRHNKFWLLA